jgi:hypothetical protein
MAALTRTLESASESVPESASESVPSPAWRWRLGRAHPQAWRLPDTRQQEGPRGIRGTPRMGFRDP